MTDRCPGRDPAHRSDARKSRNTGPSVLRKVALAAGFLLASGALLGAADRRTGAVPTQKTAIPAIEVADVIVALEEGAPYAKEQALDRMAELQLTIGDLRDQLALDPDDVELAERAAKAQNALENVSSFLGGDLPMAGVAEVSSARAMSLSNWLDKSGPGGATLGTGGRGTPMPRVRSASSTDAEVGLFAGRQDLDTDVSGFDPGEVIVDTPGDPSVFAACVPTASGPFTNTTPVAIPTVIATVSSTLLVAGAPPVIADLDLTTFITHTFNSDLDITLRSPAGTIVTITTDNGSSFDNVYNGTVWNDQANPLGQVPYGTNNGLVTDHLYVNLVPATPLVAEEPLAAFKGENPNGTWTLNISDDAGGDGGSLNSWSLNFLGLAAPPTLTTTSFTNSTPVAIPTVIATVSSTQAVAVAGTQIANVRLTTFITHTFNSDLDITLMSPTGKIATVTTDNGSSFDNVYNGTLWNVDADPGNDVPQAFPLAASNLVTDTVYANLVVETTLTPEESFGLFDGDNPNGIWTITISDDAGGDGGSLASWTIEITTSDCAGCIVNGDCNDNNPCTTDACVGGVCVFTPVVCVQDGNLCTTEVCNTSTGLCVSVPVANGTACPDGLACNGNETCVGGFCTAGTPVNCNDGTDCSIDACVEPSGTCTHTLVPGPCNDNDACTVNDQCVAAGFPDQNFDGVTAPALPAGWTTSGSGAGLPWATVTTSSHTPPNAAFTNNVGTVSSRNLDSPTFVADALGQVTFRNRFTTETGFDGAVLEISIGGGPFQDILAAGGTFASGGYTGVISVAFGSPIAGRPAWTGTTGGLFIVTTVNLPAAAAGQDTILRWRFASDNSVTSTGQWIDTIDGTSGAACRGTYECGGCCTAPGVCVFQSATACAASGGVFRGIDVACEQTGSHTASPNVAIPDGTAAGITSTITVPDSMSIADLNVSLSISHTWVGDLVVCLSHGPFTVTLVDRMGLAGVTACPGDALGCCGCAQDNLNGILLDDEGTGGLIENACVLNLSSPPNYVPNNLLTVFDGLDAQGTWTLSVSDNAALDSGTLISWSLEVVGEGSICTFPPSCDAGGPYESDCRDASINGATVNDPEGEAVNYSWASDNPDVVLSNSAGVVLPGAGDRPVPPATATYVGAAPPCGVTATLTLSVDDTTSFGSGSCQTTVTFDDDNAPVFTNEPVLGCIGCTVLWPPNHGYVDFQLSATGGVAVDECTGVTLGFASCHSSQPENANGVGDGDTERDCVISVDRQTVSMRAERNGACNPIGRTYSVTVGATDECGNVGISREMTVCVWHDRADHPVGPYLSSNQVSGQNDTRTGPNGTYGTDGSDCGNGCPADCD